MNYIKLINAFEQWIETNYLPISSQLLWYKLVALFNRCGWSEWVIVDNQRLMALMQMKREATFVETRDKLIKACLLEYRKGKKGSPNQYKINTTILKVQTEVYTEVETVVQTEVNTVDINKLNKTKHIKKNNKKKYGEYQNVLLSDEEIEKVKQDFPCDYKTRIQKLDDYIQSTGKKYKDFLATLRSWARREGYQFPSQNEEIQTKEINLDNLSEEEYAMLVKGGKHV